MPYFFSGFVFLPIWLWICKVNSQWLLGVLGYNSLYESWFLTLLIVSFIHKKKKKKVKGEVIKLRPNPSQAKCYHLVLQS